MASIRQSSVSMATSATSTVVPSLSEPEDQRQRENAVGDDVHHDPNVALDKPSLKPSPTPESEADTYVVTWDGPDDPTNPRNWSSKYRWFVTGLISLNNFCSYVQIFLVPTQHSTNYTWKDVLVFISLHRCALHRTGVSFVERGFLPCHVCVPPRICVRANFLGPRLRDVREESGAHSSARCIHTLPPGPGPRSEHDNVTRDAVSIWILRVCTVEQFGRCHGRYVGCRDARARL